MREADPKGQLLFRIYMDMMLMRRRKFFALIRKAVGFRRYSSGKERDNAYLV